MSPNFVRNWTYSITCPRYWFPLCLRVVTLIDLFACKVTARIASVKSAPPCLQCETSSALSQECSAGCAHSHPEGQWCGLASLSLTAPSCQAPLTADCFTVFSYTWGCKNNSSEFKLLQRNSSWGQCLVCSDPGRARPSCLLPVYVWQTRHPTA